MGLFSFLKNAGSKLFKKKPTKKAEAAPEAAAKVEQTITAPVINEEETKIQALTGELSRLGISTDGLNLELGEAIRVTGATETNEERERIILALGNVEGIAVVEDNITVNSPEPEAVFYTVQEGDSLSKIAKTQYGDPMKYQFIFEANKPMLEDPEKIYPGQVLRIPAVA